MTHLKYVLEGKNLSAVQVILVIQILKQEITNQENIIFILCVIIDGWNILNRIGNSKQIRYLLNRFCMELEEPIVFILYLKTNADGYNIIHRLSVLGELELLQQLLTRAKKQSKGISRSLMIARTKDRNSFLHIICSKELTNTSILSNVLEYLDVANLKELFGLPNNDQYNVLMICSRHQPISKLMEILDLLHQKVACADVMKWLQIFDQDGNNFAQVIAKYNNPLHIEILLASCIRRFLDIIFFDSIVFSQDHHGGTFLHDLAVRCPEAFFSVLGMKEFDRYFTEKIFMMIGPKGKRLFDLIAKDAKVLMETITVLGKRYGPTTVTKILTTGCETGSTLLVQILKRKSITEMFYIFNWLHENLQPGCFKILFSRSKKRGRSSFIYKNDPGRITQMLLVRIFKRIKKSDELIKNSVAKRMCLMLEIYCRCNRRLKLYDLFKWLSEHFNELEMKYLLRVQHDDKIVFLNFLQWLKLEFKEDFIEFLLIATQTGKNTFIICLCQQVEIDVYQVLKWLKQEFNIYFLKELVMMTNNQNSTFLHFLCHNKHISILELLQFLLNELAHKSFLETLLLSKDKSGKTFIQKWDHNQLEIFPLLEWLSVTFDKKFMEKLLIVDGRLLSLQSSDGVSKSLSVFLRKLFVDDAKKEKEFRKSELKMNSSVLRWTFYTKNDHLSI